MLKAQRFLIYAVCSLIFSAFMVFFSCANKNALIVGRLPLKTKCLVIMPFVQTGNFSQGGGEDEILSEFLASDLFREGFDSIFYPREIRKGYDYLLAEFPKSVDKNYGIEFGKALGGEYTLWGTVDYHTIVEIRTEGEQRIHFVSIEAFLLNNGNGDINWYYDSKKEIKGDDYMKAFASISAEMTWGLLREKQILSYINPDAECVKEGYVEKMKAHFIASKVPIGKQDEVNQTKSAEADTSKAVPEISDEKLSLDLQKIYDALARGEKVALSGVKFDGRTPNISKNGILYLNNAAKVFKSFGKDYKFKFEGHVDGTADTAGDMTLSLGRVRNVKGFLVEYAGIPDEKIEITAFGGQVPILPNINKRNRNKNKRIEVSALKIPE